MAVIFYRVAEKCTGKSYATAAVKRIVKDASEVYGLYRLEGMTSPSSIGSQIVTLKNRFQLWGRARSSHLLNGVWEDSALLERR